MVSYDEVINLSLRRAFFYPASEIHQGPAGFYSYGPYAVTIRNRLITMWRKLLIKRNGMLEIDSCIAMPEAVFKASGHLANFNDPTTTCSKCKAVHRVDRLLTEKTKEEFTESMSDDVLTTAVKKNKLKCPACKGSLGSVQRSSLMVQSLVGASKGAPMYLRPETCQSIFVDFPKLYKTMRMKLPQGIAQVGKAFRNEISPRQTLMRQVEFYQMEAEVFFNKKDINKAEYFKEVKNVKLNILLEDSKTAKIMTPDDLVKKKLVSGKLIAYYLARTQELFDAYGIPLKKTRFRQVGDDERAFYAKEGWDFEVETSIGWLELIANNYRTDHDLKSHEKGSKKDMQVLDEVTNKKFIPHIWEISIGVDRTFYAIIEHAYRKKDKRTWLQLPPALAPLDIAIFPLLSNKEELVDKAKDVKKILEEEFDTFLDTSGSIGKRYARVDEIGVPFCATIDFDTVENDNSVTLRERDTGKQQRVQIRELRSVLRKLLSGKLTFEEVSDF